MRPEITLIRKLNSDRTMSKRIFFDEHGALRSDGSQCRMVQRTATRAPAETFAKLADLLDRLTPSIARTILSPFYQKRSGEVNNSLGISVSIKVFVVFVLELTWLVH